MFVFFSNGGPNCPYKTLNIAMVSSNLSLVVFCAVLSVLPAVQNRNPRASIFTASVIGVYSTYLVGSALFSLPVAMSSSSPPLHLCDYQQPVHNEILKYLTLIIGALITFVAVAFSTMSAGSHSGSAGLSSSSSGKSERTLLVNRDENGEHHHTSDDEGNHDDPELAHQRALEKSDRELLNLDNVHHHDEHQFEAVVYNYTWFHIVMLLGAMYIGCLMSNWAVVDVDAIAIAGQGPAIDKSIVSVWLKAVSCWTVSILFVWTLVAPLILRNRDFGFDT